MRSIEVLLQEGIEAGQFGGRIEPHGDQAMGFALFSAEAQPFEGHVVDLGSGAGLPAIPLADAYPATTWSLIERRVSRAALLQRAVARLNLGARVEVLAGDAAELAWGELRGSADWVTARSFGRPAETAELGCGFLRTGGRLLVSISRSSEIPLLWPAKGLARCGLEFKEEWDLPAGRYVRLERNAADIGNLPRRGGRKSQLF